MPHPTASPAVPSNIALLLGTLALSACDHATTSPRKNLAADFLTRIQVLELAPDLVAIDEPGYRFDQSIQVVLTPTPGGAAYLACVREGKSPHNAVWSCSNGSAILRDGALALIQLRLDMVGWAGTIDLGDLAVRPGTTSVLDGSTAAQASISFGDFFVTKTFTGTVTTTPDSDPPRLAATTLIQDTDTPVWLPLTEPVSCLGITVSASREGVDVPLNSSVICPTAGQTLTHEISVAPNGFWRPGTTHLLVTGLTDGGGRAAPPTELLLTVPLANALENPSFESPLTTDMWAVDGTLRLPFVSYTDAAGNEQTIPPSEGAYLAAIGGSMAAYFPSIPAGQKVRFDIGILFHRCSVSLAPLNVTVVTTGGRFPMPSLVSGLFAGQSLCFTGWRNMEIFPDLFPGTANGFWLEIAGETSTGWPGNNHRILLDNLSVVPLAAN